MILAGDPHNLAAMIGLGNAYSESGAWREAIIEYEAGTQARSPQCRRLYRYGDCLSQHRAA